VNVDLNISFSKHNKLTFEINILING